MCSSEAMARHTNCVPYGGRIAITSIAVADCSDNAGDGRLWSGLRLGCQTVLPRSTREHRF
jgi:hypothetical protein